MLPNKTFGRGSARVICPHRAPTPLLGGEPASVNLKGYSASAGDRWVGLGGTLLIYALALACFLFTVSRVDVLHVPPTLTVMTVRPSASPPETPPQEKEAPKQAVKKEQSVLPHVKPVERPRIPVSPVSAPLPAVQPEPADPGAVQSEAAAPRTLPAPLAPQVANNARDSWEGRVLAALNRERRYPRLAMTRRQQGVPYVRFTMDRQGKILSSSLERSSGFPDLDREAVALPKRAEPLPKPPGDRYGDILELVVPVQFFLR